MITDLDNPIKSQVSLFMHALTHFYSKEYDFPSASEKNISYMIAAVPRSGSTHLSIKLWETGVLGAPMEYLTFPLIANFLLPRLGLGEIKELDGFEQREFVRYWEIVKSIRTSPNGVFGHKVFMVNVVNLMKKNPDLFKLILPDYIVFLTRKDLVAQAISYSRAIRTNKWFAGGDRLKKSDYDFSHIELMKTSLTKQYDYWETMFSMARIEPIRITYEDLVENSSQVVSHILKEMNIHPNRDMTLLLPRIEKQSDAISKNWRERYDSDRRVKLGSGAF